jgi:hypothetical protein
LGPAAIIKIDPGSPDELAGSVGRTSSTVRLEPWEKGAQEPSLTSVFGNEAQPVERENPLGDKDVTASIQVES